MFDPECFAGEGVDGGAVAGAVVGHDPLDLDPVRAEVGDCATEKADRCGCLLVFEHFDVGEPGRVIDAGVDVFPADPAASLSAVARDTVAGTSNTAELLDLDVEELAWPFALVAVRRLGRLEPRQLAQPDPGQHR